LAVASYFEKQINGIEITNEFKNGIYKNVRIKEVTGQRTSQNAIGLQGGIESNAFPVSSCYHVNIYVIEFSGWPIFLVFKTPCLPEVVVVANPNPSSGGSSSGGSFFSGIMTPPSFTPPSFGGGGSGGGSGYTPPPYSSYTPPPNWFDWNFLFQNPSYWSVADPSMMPIGTIYTPELLHLITTLGLNQAQTEWLNNIDNYQRVIEINDFLIRNYSDLSTLDKQALAIAHINAMMSDIEYLEMVESYSNMMSIGHPWMIELFKELAVELGLKVIKKYLPGYGDWQSIKDAIDNAGHGDWLGALGEVLNIVKKKVPWLAAVDAVIDVFDFGKLANKVWKAFDKIKNFPTPAFNGLLKTIKDKTGGIIGNFTHDSFGNGTSQAFIKFDTNQASNFFETLATNLGKTITPFSNKPGGWFDLGSFRFNFYFDAHSVPHLPTIEIILPSGERYKLRIIN
jgi:hypothetical protein